MTTSRVFILLVVLAVVHSYEIVSTNKQVNSILQRTSYKPALLIYERDLDRLQEKSYLYEKVEARTSDYLRIVVLDCLQNSKLPEKDIIRGCEIMVRNSMFNIQHIEGFKPSEYRILVRDKVFEITPEIKVFSGDLDQENLMSFVGELVPKYFRTLHVEQDMLNFLNSTRLHVPKVIMYLNYDDFETLQRLAIHFYERLEFGWVPQKNKNDIPLVLYNYDFKEQRFQKHVYPSKRMNDYSAIKQFLEGFATKERQYQVYDTLRMPSNQTNYVTAENLTEIFYRSQLWAVVYEGPTWEQGEKVIDAYREKFGDYLSYVIFKNQSAEESLTFGKQKAFNLSLTDPAVPPLDTFAYEQVRLKADRLIDLENSVMIVEPSLFHMCSLQNLDILENFFFCVAVKEEDIPQLKKQFKVPEDQKLALFLSKNSSNEFHAFNFKNTTFRHVAKHVYLVVYPRVKALAAYFIRNPFTAIPNGKNYREVCGDNCFFYLFDSQAPKKQEIMALKEAAYKYNDWLNFVQADYRCHEALFKHLNKEAQPGLAFSTGDKIFLFKEKVTLKLIDSIVKGFKQEKIKFKELPQALKASEDCKYEIVSFEKYLRALKESEVNEESIDSEEREQMQAETRDNAESPEEPIINTQTTTEL